jgi:RNAse (barnase) inhibitor barstar
MKKKVIIDGNNFETLGGFYDEIETKMTKNLGWKIGRNLDAYNDILRGGFGVHEYEEPMKMKWIHSDKSRRNLGQAETIKYLENNLKHCHPTNIPYVKKELEDMKNDKGKTLFERIIEITKTHQHIELEME